jgi:hypothetical protein
MLNPSTADHELDDPTIRRCMAFARAHGYGGIAVVNRYAYRATEPRELRKAVDPLGPENLRIVGETCKDRDVVVAWGAFELDTDPVDLSILLSVIHSTARSVFCLGRTKSGAPRHPLYVRGDVALDKWSRAE